MDSEPAVQHAKAVRAALAGHENAALFKLYASAPNMGRALLDVIVSRARFDALNMVVKAYRPGAPLPFLARLLGFVAQQDLPGSGSSGGAKCGGAGDGAGNDHSVEELSMTQALPGCSVAVYPGKHAPQVCTFLLHSQTLRSSYYVVLPPINLPKDSKHVACKTSL